MFVVRDGVALDRCDDGPGADGRSRLLRPEELPAGRRRGGARKAEAEAEAPRRKKEPIDGSVGSSALLGFAYGHLRRQRALPALVRDAAATGSTCTSTTARWSRSSKGRRRRRSCCPSRGDVARGRPPVTRSARRGARRARLSRGRLPPALRQALPLLPGQVPLRDPARAACGRSASASRRPSREHAPDADAARRPGARRGRAGRCGVSAVRSAVHHRSQGGEGVRHRETARGPVRGGRVHLPRRGRRHLRRRAARLDRGAARSGARRAHRGLRGRP